MMLSDVDVLRLLDEKPDFITPFDKGKLSASSYDVSMGSVLYEIAPSSGVITLSDQAAIDANYTKIDISNGFLLKPGQYVLCPIVERVSLPDDVAARVLPRTRYTRLGLLLAPQYCNPSYSGTLSLGLRNVSQNNVALVPGLSIGQLVFDHLEHRPSDERLYRNQRNAFYQNEEEFVGAKFEGELSQEAGKVYQAMLRKLSGEQ